MRNRFDPARSAAVMDIVRKRQAAMQQASKSHLYIIHLTFHAAKSRALLSRLRLQMAYILRPVLKTRRHRAWTWAFDDNTELKSAEPSKKFFTISGRVIYKRDKI
jgi:hypothetical protein